MRPLQNRSADALLECILILAPKGRDAEVIAQVCQRDGIKSRVCDDLACLCKCLEGDAAGIILTEEVLSESAVEPLVAWCEEQPPWSDIPIIVLATKRIGHRSGRAATLLDRLGNVALLERPVNAETLATAARASIRGRRRQYQARALLLDRERNQQELLRLNETLEQRVEQRASELDQANATLAFALESAGMGSWDVDLVTQTAQHTLGHDRIFGYPDGLGSWSTDDFLAHVIEEDWQAVRTAFETALVQGTLEIECRIRRPSGAVRWIAARGKVGYDPTGIPARMAGVVMDTTERRATEDALHQAQKMEAIGQLTGGVAHDFNNLLTVIVGALDMVMRKPEKLDRVIRLSGAAMTAARRGEQLTQQLLAFSRRQMLRPQTLDANGLLNDFEGLARRAAGGAVMVQFLLEAGAYPINVDPAQFESAVLNLIVNARDAMPGGGSITLASENLRLPDGSGRGASLRPGRYLCVSVEDTGSGMDAETMKHVFEPFFTTKDVGKGTGLGLSQVYGFARGAGGDIEIDTELGRGTQFRIILPRSDGAIIDERQDAVAPAPLVMAIDETVLLVEDDEQVLALAMESLEELNYRVIVARNAREALGHLHSDERIDIMFSDVIMPGGMNGGQLAAEARLVRPNLKVLLTSGYVGELEKRSLIADDLEVLTKPYRGDELARKLQIVSGTAGLAASLVGRPDL